MSPTRKKSESIPLPQEPGSLSENVMKEDDRVLFQPFHPKRYCRGSRCDHFENSVDLLALVFKKMQFS